MQTTASSTDTSRDIFWRAWETCDSVHAQALLGRGTTLGRYDQGVVTTKAAKLANFASILVSGTADALVGSVHGTTATAAQTQAVTGALGAEQNVGAIAGRVVAAASGCGQEADWK